MTTNPQNVNLANRVINGLMSILTIPQINIAPNAKQLIEAIGANPEIIFHAGEPHTFNNAFYDRNDCIYYDGEVSFVGPDMTAIHFNLTVEYQLDFCTEIMDGRPYETFCEHQKKLEVGTITGDYGNDVSEWKIAPSSEFISYIESEIKEYLHQ